MEMIEHLTFNLKSTKYKQNQWKYEKENLMEKLLIKLQWKDVNKIFNEKIWREYSPIFTIG